MISKKSIVTTKAGSETRITGISGDRSPTTNIKEPKSGKSKLRVDFLIAAEFFRNFEEIKAEAIKKYGNCEDPILELYRYCKLKGVSQERQNPGAGPEPEVLGQLYMLGLGE